MFANILLLVGPATTRESGSVRRAEALARAAGAAVEVLGVVYEPHLEGYLGHGEIYAGLRERLVAERRGRAAAVAAGLGADGVRAHAHAVWAHPTSEGVCREAAQSGADLVVIEPGGDSGRLSHEDWRLISGCPAAVLVVRSGARASYSKIVAGVDPSHEHGKPPQLDLSILRAAKAIGALSGAPVEAVHCFTPLALFVPDSALDGIAIGDVERSLEAGRREDLLRLVQQVDLPADAATIVEGRPDVMLSRQADTDALLVLGNVSRGPIRSLLLGSTAERVLHSAGGDVLIVKPPGAAA